MKRFIFFLAFCLLLTPYAFADMDCIPTLSPDGRLHLPVVSSENSSYSMDLQYLPTTDGSTWFAISGIGAPDNVTCGNPAMILDDSGPFLLYVPSLPLGSGSYWATLEYAPLPASAQISMPEYADSDSEQQEASAPLHYGLRVDEADSILNPVKSIPPPEIAKRLSLSTGITITSDWSAGGAGMRYTTTVKASADVALPPPVSNPKPNTDVYVRLKDRPLKSTVTIDQLTCQLQAAGSPCSCRAALFTKRSGKMRLLVRALKITNEKTAQAGIYSPRAAATIDIPDLFDIRIYTSCPGVPGEALTDIYELVIFKNYASRGSRFEGLGTGTYVKGVGWSVEMKPDPLLYLGNFAGVTYTGGSTVTETPSNFETVTYETMDTNINLWDQ